MTLGHEIAAALPELRAHAESMMVDSCRITRPGEGEGTINEETGQYDPPEPVTVYEGKCEFKLPDANARAEEVAGSSFAMQWVTVKLPMETPGVVGTSADVREDNEVECLTSGDPWLEGQKFRVDALDGGAHRTSRRLRCEFNGGEV